VSVVDHHIVRSKISVDDAFGSEFQQAFGELTGIFNYLFLAERFLIADALLQPFPQRPFVHFFKNEADVPDTFGPSVWQLQVMVEKPLVFLEFRVLMQQAMQLDGPVGSFEEAQAVKLCGYLVDVLALSVVVDHPAPLVDAVVLAVGQSLHEVAGQSFELDRGEQLSAEVEGGLGVCELEVLIRGLAGRSQRVAALVGVGPHHKVADEAVFADAGFRDGCLLGKLGVPAG
jgi:hypothetical protein